ncbi:hypothetical protein FRC00_009117, partial [Tulasnella sp. 408]
VSKTVAVWLDAFHWITQGRNEWKALLKPNSACRVAGELENIVTRMVRLHRNWSSKQLVPERITHFYSTRGFEMALLPGGRWFLSSTRDKTGCLMYYDVDTEMPAGRVLVDNDRDGQDIWALTISLDHTTNPFEFDLAIELAEEDELFTHSGIPRKIAVWRVSSKDDDSLSAKPTCSFSVFRESSVHESLSMYGHALLRVSYSSSRETVFTLHRWDSPQGGVVSHSILLPQTSSPL